MRARKTLAVSFAFLLASSGAFAAGDKEKKDMEKALKDFQISAKRLEKAVTKAADENTKEIRQSLADSLKKALKDISNSLNRTAEKLEKSTEKPKDN